MEEKKNVNPSPELPDEALDTVSGGAFGRVAHEANETHETHKPACRRCGCEFPTLIGGYCPTCYDELKKESIYMPMPR